MSWIWSLPKLTIPLSSKLVQPLNFAIFDIVLISLVFHLSSDVAGRLNDAILRNGQPERLIIRCPPVVGGGLVSTRRFHVIVLFFVRVVGLALILASELTLNGVTQDVKYETEANLMLPGTVTNFTLSQYKEALVRRTSCIASNQKRMYYGLVVNNECITDRILVFDKAVRFGVDIVFHNMSLGKIERTRVRGDLREYYHEQGIMQCLFLEGEVNNSTCRAVLSFNGISYITETGAVRPGMPDEPTEARIIENHDWKDDRWIDGGLVTMDLGIVDAIHAVYGATNRTQSVTLVRPENRTEVSFLWFVALGAKVFIVLALFVAIVVLRRNGYRVVVNDERRLVELLRRRIEEDDPRLTRDGAPRIFLNASRQGSAARSRLHIVVAGLPGVPENHVGASSAGQRTNNDEPTINWTADNIPVY